MEASSLKVKDLKGFGVQGVTVNYPWSVHVFPICINETTFNDMQLASLQHPVLSAPLLERLRRGRPYAAGAPV